MYGGRGRFSFAVIALAAFVGCSGPGTDIILTTRLPVEAAPGENERLMYEMCTHLGKQKERPEDALKVAFVNNSGIVSERIVRCEEVRKRFKPKDAK